MASHQVTYLVWYYEEKVNSEFHSYETKMNSFDNNNNVVQTIKNN